MSSVIAAATTPAATSTAVNFFPFPPEPLSHSTCTYTTGRCRRSLNILSRWFSSQIHRSYAFGALSFTSNGNNKNKSRSKKKLFPCQAALPFDLSPPPIDHDHEDTKTVTDDGTVVAFHTDDEAFDAAQNGAVVVDLSHYGRIRVLGEDRIQFLHNQSTANFECLSEGQGCTTVFVTPTARTIDIAHAWVMKNAITLVVSPVTCERIAKMLEKYIFISDKVEIQDITKQTCMFVLVGPASNQIMERLDLVDLIGQPYGSHKHYSVIEFGQLYKILMPILFFWEHLMSGLLLVG